MKHRQKLRLLSFLCAFGLMPTPTDAGQSGNPATGSIAGSVTNRTTGNGLEGAKVEITGLGVSRLVDKTGRYVITGVPAGTHDVTASYWGLESTRATQSHRHDPKSDVMFHFEPHVPPKTIPRVPGGDPFLEWINACKGGPLPGSNFEYAAPLTEMVLLGNVALRARGRKLEWDSARLRFPNAPEMGKFLRPELREF